MPGSQVHTRTTDNGKEFALHRLNHSLNHSLNQRPRKGLGFKTPHEVFMKQLHLRHNAVAIHT